MVFLSEPACLGSVLHLLTFTLPDTLFTRKKDKVCLCVLGTQPSLDEQTHL